MLLINRLFDLIEFFNTHSSLESAEDYEKAYEESYGEGSLKDYFLQEKVVQWLVENSVKVD